jgi:hypothetical protein
MTKDAQRSETDLVLESSLQGFFYDQLSQVNKKSSKPLATEIIFYSSNVLDLYGDSKRYFEIVEGRVREKTLGIKLLESSQYSSSIQKQVVKDVADTALFMCGFFSDSLKAKIVDLSYYHQIGRDAYAMLNGLMPSYFEVNDFYKKMSYNFDCITSMLNVVSSAFTSDIKTNEIFFISAPIKSGRAS